MELYEIKQKLKDKGWKDNILKLSIMLKDIQDITKESEKDLLEELGNKIQKETKNYTKLSGIENIESWRLEKLSIK